VAHTPDALRATTILDLELWQWLGVPLAVVAAVILGRLAAWTLTRAGGEIAAHTSVRWDNELIRATRHPLRLLFAVLAFRGISAMLGLPGVLGLVMTRIEGIAASIAVAWLLIRVMHIAGDAVERRAGASVATSEDAGRSARGVTTQVRVLRRVATFAIVLVALALVLTQFEVVRNVGFSLLASAGIAGVVLGLAAQKTLAGLLAGIQLSATQPIRIGDVVIIEGEWGTIEEVTLTFVIVKIWDERRLVVPITRFFEQPFQNWTMSSSQLLGTVFLYVDWTFPVDAMREELTRITSTSAFWDGRVQNVQVTGAKESTLEVRALVSAADASALWDLRVHVREQLVLWLQRLDGGRHLPRIRLEEPAPPSPPT